MKIDFIKIIGTCISFFQNRNKDEFGNWLKTASDEELNEKWHEKYDEWADNGYGGNGIKTPEMKCIEEEMNARSREKWQNDPRRNTDSNYRWTDKNRWEKD